MIISVIGEGGEDTEFLATIARAVLGVDVTVVPRPAGGWSDLLRLAPIFVAADHQNGFEGSIVLGDSDDSPIAPGDAPPDVYAKRGRIELLRRGIDARRARLPARSGRPPINVTIGLAVPALEAWCLSLDDDAITESATRLAVRDGRRAFDRDDLKERLYGSRRVSIQNRIEIVRQCAERVAGQLDHFARRFPLGFGALLKHVRSWRG